MIAFLEATLTQDGGPPLRFSKRYHAGVGPGIDLSVWPVQSAVTPAARRELIAELRSCLAPSDEREPSGEPSLPERKEAALASFATVAPDELPGWAR